MKHGEIDDLLANIDGDSEVVLSNEESQPGKEKKEKKEKKIVSQYVKDISFLVDIDSDKPADVVNNFQESLGEELLVDFSESGIEDSEEKPEHIPEIKPELHVADKSEEKENKSTEFILRGTRSWNTREPYILPIDKEKFNSDNEDLNRSFYFVKGDLGEQAVQSEMRRAMFKFITASGKNIKDVFSEFIYNNISSIVASIGNDFSIADDKRELFIYHTGVWTLHRILLYTLQNNGSYCYKLLTEKKAVKYFPFEFIKDTVIKWHNDNIYNDIPYDGIIEYNELKRLVSKRYNDELDKNNKKLDEVISNSKTGSIDREQIFKSKCKEWFGRTNILVYNRFLERTVFKTISKVPV